MVLMAQSVPSATSVPVRRLAPGRLELGGVAPSTSDRTRFWLDSDGRREPCRRGHAAAARETARSTDATEVPSDEAGMRRFERPEQLPPDLRSTRIYLFEGGCVTYDFAFDGDAIDLA